MATGAPSSVKKTAPASAILRSSDISLPSLFLLTHPAGRILDAPAALPWLKTYSTRDGSDIAGLVLGIATIVVKPPAAPALAPEAISSFHSPPGSLKWACRSIKPGVKILPYPSITEASSDTISAPIFATTPSSTRSESPSANLYPSNILKPLKRIFSIILRLLRRDRAAPCV